ncbi:MAG: proteasome subunit alpha [Candidatus Poribacteria bacterium]|nr:proteasome subunit alpha [Candidatus Poribacteria bacterium]
MDTMPPATDFQGDFLSLLSSRGHRLSFGGQLDSSRLAQTEATTVLAMRYKDGVLVAGDRQATAGTTIMYNRADKVIDIDDHSTLAISGSPAMAFEMARVLEYSFRYYKRSQLQELSLEGKLRTLSRLIKENVGAALQGIGAVMPIFAAYDTITDEGRIYFYDVLGAQFEMTEFAVAGSGSVWIRGTLYYENRWTKKLVEMNRREAVGLALRMLESAAYYDAATGGVKEQQEMLPTIKCVTADGIETVDSETLREIYAEVVEGA